MRTPKEIKTEIEKLRALKPRIRRFSSFGDDHWANLEAQIDVLENKTDLKSPEDLDGGIELSSSRYYAIQEAIDWLAGDKEQLADDPENWLSLVKK